MSDDHPLLATLGQRARRIVGAGLPPDSAEHVKAERDRDAATEGEPLASVPVVPPPGDRQPFWLWRGFSSKGGSRVSEPPVEATMSDSVRSSAPPEASHELADGLAAVVARWGSGIASGRPLARIGLVACVGLLGAATTGAVSLLQEPDYAARAALIVKFGREYVYRPELDGISGWQPSRMLELVNNEAQILQSRDLHAEVVAALGESVRSAVSATAPIDAEAANDRAGAGRTLVDAQALARFEDRLSIRPIGDTTIVAVAFEHPDPNYATRALDLLLDRYFKRRAELLDGAKGTPASLEALRQELAGARQRLARYLDEHEAWDLDQQREAIAAAAEDEPRGRAIRPVRRPLGGRGSSDEDLDTGMLLSALEEAAPSPQLGLRDLSSVADGVAERRLAVAAAEEAYAFALRRSVEDAVSRTLDSSGASNVSVLDRPRVDAEPQGLPVWMRVLVGGLLAAGAMTAVLILLAGSPAAAARKEA